MPLFQKSAEQKALEQWVDYCNRVLNNVAKSPPEDAERIGGALMQQMVATKELPKDFREAVIRRTKDFLGTIYTKEMELYLRKAQEALHAGSAANLDRNVRLVEEYLQKARQVGAESGAIAAVERRLDNIRHHRSRKAG